MIWWKWITITSGIAAWLVTTEYRINPVAKKSVQLVHETAGDKSFADEVYRKLQLDSLGLDSTLFARAANGYAQLASKGLLKKPLLTIADMTQPSGNRRLYIINMEAVKLVKHTLVAHGQKSGDVWATDFSNHAKSHQSSLGFYVTGATYQGGNGLSMRLHGMEQGFNDKALERAIVMHGAHYVNEQAARAGRIGRSWGCPAVSMQEHRQIIDWLKDGSCLFIVGKDPRYLATSTLAAPAASGAGIN